MVVTSEEMMSLYAANNICRAIQRHEANGVYLVGLVANLRDTADDDSRVQAFARRIGTRVLAVIPRDPVFRAAELKRLPLVDLAPGSALVDRFEGLADSLLAARREDCPTPTPMDEDAFDTFVEEVFDTP